MKLRCECVVVNVGMRTLEDDEDRSYGRSLCFRTIGEYHSHCGHHYIIGFDHQGQGWKTESLLKGFYDHLVVARVEVRAGYLISYIQVRT